jgi:hypothetical protein
MSIEKKKEKQHLFFPPHEIDALLEFVYGELDTAGKGKAKKGGRSAIRLRRLPPPALCVRPRRPRLLYRCLAPVQRHLPAVPRCAVRVRGCVRHRTRHQGAEASKRRCGRVTSRAASCNPSGLAGSTTSRASRRRGEHQRPPMQVLLHGLLPACPFQQAAPGLRPREERRQSRRQHVRVVRYYLGKKIQ